MAREADVRRGPFDPGGQPETRSGNAMELGFFAWNLASGMTVSKGRWGLNVVTGAGNRYENRMFGQEPVEHDTAYDMADEFVTLMKWLWASDEPIDFEGDYYQAYDALLRPKPVRQPRPVLMNAGNSGVGLDFAARHCDLVFMTGRTLSEYRDM